MRLREKNVNTLHAPPPRAKKFVCCVALSMLARRRLERVLRRTENGSSVSKKNRATSTTHLTYTAYTPTNNRNTKMLCSRVCFSRNIANTMFGSAAVAALASSSSSSSAAAIAARPWLPRRWAATDVGADAGKAGEGELPEAAKEELAKLRAELKKMQEQAVESKNAALYSAAEAENARRIAREDVDKAKAYGITSFAKDMLDVNDTLERAIDAFGKLDPAEVKMLTEHKLFSQLVTGVKMSHNMMVHNLGRNQIELIEANKGDKFDPTKHDAVFTAPVTDDVKEGEIAVVTKKGYMLKSRVLRAAQCGVAQKS